MNRLTYIRFLLVIGLMLQLTGCGGGGDSAVPPAQLTKADLRLSAQGTTTSLVGTIDISFPIPADYRVQTVALSGNTLDKQGSYLDWSVTPPAGNSTSSTLILKLAVPTGFNLGEFATVSLALNSGRASAADFGSNVSFSARDLNSATIPATAISSVIELVNVR